MTKLLRLGAIALLSGSLAIIGCSDDSSSPGGSGGTAGAGGTAGGGGTAGTGGAGGTGGGTGGAGGACDQTCGVGNLPPPDGAEDDSSVLACTVQSVPVDLPVTLSAEPTMGDLMDGPNEIALYTQVVLTEQFVDVAAALQDRGELTTAQGSVLLSVSGGPTTVRLTPLPCTICFETGTEVDLDFDAETDTYDVMGGEITFTLDEVDLVIDGFPLSTGTDCSWNPAPPTVTLSVPEL